MLHPRVLPAIGLGAELVEMYRDTDYARLVINLLSAGEDFVLVEQDVEVRPGFVAGLAECERPWCFHAYAFSLPYDRVGLVVPLGCTKLRGSIIGRPALLRRHHWLGFDSHLGEVLVGEGYEAHRHPGDAIHWHDYRSGSTHAGCCM
jgi:hypothetical protein